MIEQRLMNQDEFHWLFDTHMGDHFPADELKPFSIMEQSVREGNYFPYGYYEDGELLAYTCLLKSGDFFLLDYFAVMEEYAIKPEAMLLIVRYCIDLKGESIPQNYILQVAKNFAAEGITTVEQIESQLAYREANKADVGAFCATLSLGEATKVLVDENAGRFMVTSARNYSEANPDVLKLSDRQQVRDSLASAVSCGRRARGNRH